VVAPHQGRVAVEFVRETFGLSQVRACNVIGIHRSTFRYRSTREDDPVLRERIKALATTHKRFGYRRIHWRLTRREGFKVNHKRVYRIYKEEGLKVLRKKRKKSLSAARLALDAVLRPNQRWTMDFVEDALASGRKLRTLTIVDEYSRECPRIEADSSLPGARVVRVLDELMATRGKPESLLVDNGPEFIGKALDLWSYNNGVTLHFTRPGKPTDKPHVESFNGKFRDECLNENYFLSVHDARRIIENWRHSYNHDRPHMALKGLTPMEFLERWSALKAELDLVEPSEVREQNQVAPPCRSLT